MTQKEINKLKKRVYSISNCMFPLDTFFNDIEQNKDPDFNKESAYNDLKLITDVVYELKEKQKDYTLEEVEKLWKEIDYGKVWSSKPRPNEIRFRNSNESEIVIYTNDKSYFKYSPYRNVIAISSKEHDLITKTIKALEKMEEKKNEQVSKNNENNS